MESGKKVKIIWLLSIIIVALFSIFAYQAFNPQNKKVTPLETQQILKNTWSKLDPAEIVEVKSDLTKSTVKKVKTTSLSYESYYIKKNYNAEWVYLVIFQSNDSSIIGNLEKIVDINTGEIIGYNLRD